MYNDCGVISTTWQELAGVIPLVGPQMATHMALKRIENTIHRIRIRLHAEINNITFEAVGNSYGVFPDQCSYSDGP